MTSSKRTLLANQIICRVKEEVPASTPQLSWAGFVTKLVTGLNQGLTTAQHEVSFAANSDSLGELPLLRLLSVLLSSSARKVVLFIRLGSPVWGKSE